ncbi:hypothetical protein [Caldifermentibacillus hisashii]|uniref:hypothetical protein n=1 Tax=Caldifermentibacillus hisashii TaxID=996558 RepID=UPI001C110CC3|nr:hypothetical protein [Caldifermentibacillus hisashii]MBU5342300.1 hypothetical protein [Caldifermentibacillus hisashii]
MDIEQALESVRLIYVNLPKRYDEVKREIKQSELEIEDLEHVLEFSNFNASDGYKLAKELKEVRQRRRTLKNELELLEVIKRLNSFPKPQEKHISQAIGDIRKTLQIQKERCYSMRIRHDLQDRVR